MNKPRKTFHFKSPIEIKGDWMLGLTDIEVYNSIFIITGDNNKIELFKSPDEKIGGISYTKVRDEIEKDLRISNTTATDLPDDIIAPIIIKEYREQVTKRKKDDKYMYISSGYFRSILQDFENFLRIEVNLVEDDNKLVLDDYNSSFNAYEILPDIYTFKDISEVLLSFLQSEFEGHYNAIDIEFAGVTKKTNLFVRLGIITIRFDDKSFFSTVFDFTPGWDYKHYNEYISQKILNLSSTNKVHLKCDIMVV